MESKYHGYVFLVVLTFLGFQDENDHILVVLYFMNFYYLLFTVLDGIFISLDCRNKSINADCVNVISSFILSESVVVNLHDWELEIL